MKYYFVAIVTISIWGSTFVFTKMLLQNGLLPAQIFTLRFLIAYVLMLLGSILTRQHVKFLCRSWKDEFLMILLGITGGSIYFLTENAALLYTTATNTSLIVCSCPLFAMLLVAVVYRHSEHISKTQVVGSLIACVGMAVVVLNGRFVLHLSPRGDILAFAACLCWAFYSLFMKTALQRYNTLFITRKVFFYGLVTIMPYYVFVPEFPSFDKLLCPDILWNLLFLGVVASMLCYIIWNWVISRLGAVVATNLVYFNPIATIIFAWWLLDERITLWFLLGTMLILAGMMLSDKRNIKIKKLDNL